MPDQIRAKPLDQVRLVGLLSLLLSLLSLGGGLSLGLLTLNGTAGQLLHRAAGLEENQGAEGRGQRRGTCWIKWPRAAQQPTAQCKTCARTKNTTRSCSIVQHKLCWMPTGHGKPAVASWQGPPALLNPPSLIKHTLGREQPDTMRSTSVRVMMDWAVPSGDSTYTRCRRLGV